MKKLFVSFLITAALLLSLPQPSHGFGESGISPLDLFEEFYGD